jgi:hypothetical protein
MIVFRATQKLLSHLPFEPVEPTAESTTALGDWYATPLFIGKQRFVLIASERSLLPVVLPLRESRTLIERWRGLVAGRLDALGVEPEHRDAELDAMRDVVVAKTASRRTLGAMNDLVQHARWIAEDNGAVYPDEIEHRLDRMPCGSIKYEYPADLARFLLEERHTAVRVPCRAYLLKVALALQPDMWRVLKVSDSHTLDCIHELIDAAFDRFEPHLYAFYLTPPAPQSARRRTEMKEYVHPFVLQDAPFEDGWAVDASKTKLRSLDLREGQTFEYLFDFGADVRHAITVEAIAPSGGELLVHPVVVERHGEFADR